jgi:hypothetical protein
MLFVNQFFERMNQSLGPERARACIEETLTAMSTRQLRNADDVVVFANHLIKRGGLFEVIGGALRVQAILRGGKQDAAPAARSAQAHAGLTR